MKSLLVCIIICIYQKKAVILSAIRSTVVERLNVKDINGKQCVFCAWRRRWVRLTPEEWVRQHFLHRLVSDYGYPSGRIGVEVAIAVGEAKKRCDAVVYDEQLQPLVLIECKAEHVALTQRTLDQAITYNRQLNVPYLFLHNGPETVVVRVEPRTRNQEQRQNSLVALGTKNREQRLNSSETEEIVVLVEILWELGSFSIRCQLAIILYWRI